MYRGINLASARLGAEAVACSDDFFAPMSRLIQDSEPVFHADRFDENGKWMDGWESRRRRGGGFDWCVVRLAVPGRVLGFELDTRHFTGNYPPGAVLDGATGDECPAADSPDWLPLTPQLSLEGDARQTVECADQATVFRWVRLRIYPDGGLARLRVIGQPRANVEPGGRLELSALLNGGRVVAVSDSHYGNPEAVIMAGRGVNMGDGWETARRRVPGNEWIIIGLGVPGVVDEIEIDTGHFKGNYPAAVSVQAAEMPAMYDDALVTQAMFWPELLAEQPLGADRVHRFPIDPGPPVTHVKVNSHPDGGISRIRAFGMSRRD